MDNYATLFMLLPPPGLNGEAALAGPTLLKGHRHCCRYKLFSNKRQIVVFHHHFICIMFIDQMCFENIFDPVLISSQS